MDSGIAIWIAWPAQSHTSASVYGQIPELARVDAGEHVSRVHMGS